MLSLGFDKINGFRIHIIGIKGTGCSALAEILCHYGACVSGSDTEEDFYTQKSLNKLEISIYNQFSVHNIHRDIGLVIYSAAYAEYNEELSEAKRLRIPSLSYPQALGLLSENSLGVAVAGVHGKTTTTAMLGLMAKSHGWPATVVLGALVSGFNSSATYIAGGDIFIAETCEYREHFMNFHPKAIVITAIEWDHQDYYKSLEEIENAFLRFVLKLSWGGIVVYNADCSSTQKVINLVKKDREDICFYAFGRNDSSDFLIKEEKVFNEFNSFYLSTIDSDFLLRLPGAHNVANSSAALVMMYALAKHYAFFWDKSLSYKVLMQFEGLSRRLEVISAGNNKDGVLVLDDYAHHPTAIASTIGGLRSFYPNRRIVLSFMSHTDSRTKALFEDFAQAVSLADIIILHKVYVSAREVGSHESQGKRLFQATQRYKPKGVFYVEEPLDSLYLVKSLLQHGDIFITMGAGDNFHLAHKLVEEW